jgi:molybdopterin/thiamine biosynthesis adenylyltransferase
MVRRLTLKAADAFHKDYDLVIDGSDNFDTRYLINDACYLAGEANVHGSGGAVPPWILSSMMPVDFATAAPSRPVTTS